MDAMRTHVAELQHPLRKKFPLGIEVPFIRQRNGEILIQPWCTQVRTGAVRGVEKAWRESGGTGRSGDGAGQDPGGGQSGVRGTSDGENHGRTGLRHSLRARAYVAAEPVVEIA